MARLAPQVRSNSVPLLPRTMALVVVVAVLAFLAGALLGGARSPEPPIASPSAAAAFGRSPVSPSAVPATQSFSPVAPLLRVSAFAEGLDPASLIRTLPGGKACVIDETTGPGVPGMSLVRTWLAACPLEGLGVNFVALLVRAVIEAMPDLTGSSSGPDTGGIADQQLEYNDGAFAGTITVVSAERSGSLVLAFTLEEAAVASPGP